MLIYVFFFLFATEYEKFWWKVNYNLSFRKGHEWTEIIPWLQNSWWDLVSLLCGEQELLHKRAEIHAGRQRANCAGCFLTFLPSRVSISYSCITNYFHIWYLKTVILNYLTISVGQKPRHSLATSSGSGSLRGLKTHAKTWLVRDSLPSSLAWILPGFSSSWHCWAEDLSSLLGLRLISFPCHVGLSIGKFVPWQLASHRMSKWESKRISKMEAEARSQDGTISWKWHSNTFVIFFSSEVCDYVHPTFKGRILHKGMNTRRQGSLGATLDATSHNPNSFSAFIWILVGLHQSGSCPLAFCWVLPMRVLAGE